MKQLTPKLYRGSKDDSFRMIASKKVEVVINLETETRELMFGGANDEMLLCLKNQVALYDFQLSGYLPPPFEVVKGIMMIIRKGYVTMFHCRAGHERTGFIAVICRVVLEGWNFEAAVCEWINEGCHPLWVWAWKPTLKRYCEGGAL